MLVFVGADKVDLLWLKCLFFVTAHCDSTLCSPLYQVAVDFLELSRAMVSLGHSPQVCRQLVLAVVGSVVISGTLFFLSCSICLQG